MIETGLACCHDPFGFAQGRLFDSEPQNRRLCAQDDSVFVPSEIHFVVAWRLEQTGVVKFGILRA
jgi:hypothetical protein